MQTKLAEYVHRDSPLHRLDARWKLAAAAMCVVTVLILRTLPAAGLALLVSVLLLWLSRLPWSWFIARLGSVALFLLLVLVLLPFTVPGEGVDVGSFHASARGTLLALLIGAKVLTITALTLLVSATAPLEQTLKAAHALCAPGLLVQLIMLTYRYLFVFGDELDKLRITLRLRCYRNRATAHSYRTIGNVTGSLLVRSYERAEQVGQAMRCRAFDGRFRTLQRFHTTRTDLVSAGGLVFAAAILPLFLDLCLSAR
jgi:cobalt/nickel transport system permease protein